MKYGLYLPNFGPFGDPLLAAVQDGIVFARALGGDVINRETSLKVYDELLRLTNPISIGS